MIGGAALAAWIPLWNFISVVSTIDFVRVNGGRSSIGTFFLPRGIADITTVLGIGVMVYAFILLSKPSAAGGPQGPSPDWLGRLADDQSQNVESLLYFLSR